MDNKAQGALEYLLLIGGALIVAAVVIALAMNLMGSGKTVATNASTAVNSSLQNGLSQI